MTDRELGLEALQYYFDLSKQNYPTNMITDFDTFIKAIDKKSKHFIAGFGLGINLTESRGRKVSQAMDSLHHHLKGGLPHNLNLFRDALNERLQQYDLSFWKNVAVDTGMDIIEGSQEVGKSVIGGGAGILSLVSNAKTMLPIALIGYFGFKIFLSEYFKSRKG